MTTPDNDKAVSGAGSGSIYIETGESKHAGSGQLHLGTGHGAQGGIISIKAGTSSERDVAGGGILLSGGDGASGATPYGASDGGDVHS